MWQEPTPKKITDATDATDTTPGERMLYALGQMHRRWRAGTKGAVPPHRVNVEAVARIIGAWGEVEFIQGADSEDERSARRAEERFYIHFPSEVIVFDPRCDFPWLLLGVFEWAERQEVREFWRYFH
jgi:hypothetical protein